MVLYCRVADPGVGLIYIRIGEDQFFDSSAEANVSVQATSLVFTQRRPRVAVCRLCETQKYLDFMQLLKLRFRASH